MKDTNPQYYEGILQLRNPNKGVIKFIEEEIAKKKGVFISKTLKVGNGYDFYISSKRHLKTLGHMLKKQFGGELKISSRLYSVDRQTSKELHRVTVLYRCCSIKKGSIVELRGEKIKIMSLGHRIQGKRLADGKKVYVDFKELAYSK